MRLCKGFTVIELVLVIAVIAILAVMVGARNRDIQSLRTDFAAKKIRSDIRFAQAMAVSIQKRAGILFLADQDLYSLYVEDTPGNWTKAVDPFRKGEFTVQLNSGEFQGVTIQLVYFNGYNNALIFNQWGNPFAYELSSGSASPLNNPAGVRLAGPKDVRVERGTGRAYIQ